MGIVNKITRLQTTLLGRYYPKKLAEILYRKKFNKSINWSTPLDINEKINWIAFNTNTSIWTEHADKYVVREYVKKKGYSNILTKLIGIWSSHDYIDFKSLPDSFVLKCNHDAGSVIVIENKSNINEYEIKNKLKTSLSSAFGIETAEPHYLKIVRKIIAEEFIINDNQISDSLIDYKFWCFHGKAAYCHVVYDKTVYKNKKTGIYSLPDWKLQENKLKNETSESIPKPKMLKEMIEIAESLSTSFLQCRVDLYNSNKRIYFGELTFTAGCGRINNYTDNFLVELGDKINIP
ncbi:MAG: hypothetical protein JEZ01_20430 [Labilibaculum sp.]|nr:ATP-grasp fold amidoligase family protein [Labilibaculum sp.]MBI9060146.1 hypothetical protein [Labilibaculum sp.]